MIILQDTKEKTPWSFTSFGQCAAQKLIHLEEGDYTIEEYPLLVAIERKKTVEELATNLGIKYTQFKNEMERLRKYRFRYVVCEFSEIDILNYPHKSRLPAAVKAKLRMNGKFLMHRIGELIDTYEIEFVYCNSRYSATKKAMELLLDAERIYQQERINTQ